ncbi:tyrosine-type recombinase/integrase [Terribacillus saccharophilus]|uniref:tyrosine-type recombinase/integrase n=1 Tax=Terribacillus saccharophilus TaxID=361277 RepID=UPI000C9BA1EC|nr:tyrosine-type recombinase/integrase [Terribacillus goriensis]
MRNQNEFIEPLSDSSIDLIDNCSYTDLFSKFKNDGLIKGSFNDLIWTLKHPHSSGRNVNIDFLKLNVSIRKDKNSTLVVKAWVLSLMEKYNTITTQVNFFNLVQSLNRTSFFSLESIKKYEDWLHSSKVSENTKITIIYSTLNFLDFIQHNNSDEYIQLLYNVRNKIKYIRPQRELPPSKDIIMFSSCLEDYIGLLSKKKDYSQEALNRLILFYPIYIWWKLTSIIPIRSVEFTSIKRDCLYKSNGKYYLILPRKKQPTYSKSSLTDHVAITQKLYTLINDYIEMTLEFGDTSTLISYPSLIYTDQYSTRSYQKRDIRYFNRENLEKLLKRFYKEVIISKYKQDLEQLTPNDTRHLAFVSLMMQGYSPLEIAKIGGHQTIRAQYHYMHHIEYWIDSEVFLLLNNIHSPLQEQDNELSSDIIARAFQPPTSNYKGKLEIGFCSDDQQRCEAEICFYCSHWRIDFNELKEKKQFILNEINEKRLVLRELGEFIKQLHIKILETNEIQSAQHYTEQLKGTVKNMQSKLQSYSSILMFRERW